MLFRPSGVLIEVRLGARDGLLNHFLRDALVINPFVVIRQIVAQTVNAGLGGGIVGGVLEMVEEPNLELGVGEGEPSAYRPSGGLDPGGKFVEVGFFPLVTVNNKPHLLAWLEGSSMFFQPIKDLQGCTFPV